MNLKKDKKAILASRLVHQNRSQNCSFVFFKKSIPYIYIYIIHSLYLYFLHEIKQPGLL